MKNIDPHVYERVVMTGEPLDSAYAAMIMLHGRGATAENIITLAEEFDTDGFVFIAPQAADNTWYPHSFLNPIESNEPGITSGLNKISSLIAMVEDRNIPSERIYLLGFSQGACLTLEYAARHAKRYGGIFGLSGGLIGANVTASNYSGLMNSTPVFLGCSDVDPHIPVERVHETADIFNKLDADVTKVIYPGMGHTVNEDELDFINNLLKSVQVSR